MKLEKLTIKGFEKPGSNGAGENPVGGENPYIVMINPAGLTIGKKINRNQEEKPHGKQEISSLGSFAADTLSFELVFDGTGLVFDGDGKTKNGVFVQAEIQKLEELAYNFQTESHQSNFLEIKWGEKFIFRGYLTSIQINYTLFDSAGNALRAKLNLSFEGYIPPAKFEKNPGQASPDKTHLRFPDQSDTLANYCANIYGDPKYVIQAAKFNRLVNFRKLKPGRRLEFPPLINQR